MKYLRKIKCIKLLLLQVIFTFSILVGKAQDGPTILKESPKPPEVANLGRYFDLPVGTSTGIPDIGIPIWNVNYGKINIPIRLSYHAGGIKVDDIASNVGLGWILSSGASIMKINRGKPDKINFAFNYTDIQTYLNGSMTEGEKGIYFRQIQRGEKDPEPDVYAFTLPGVQGKFFELGNGDFCTVPMDLGVKVAKEGEYNWKLTDKLGNQYIFLVSDHTETIYDSYSSASGSGNSGPFHSTNLWYVNKIKDINGNEVIFDYSPIYSSLINKPVETVEIYGLNYANNNRVHKKALIATTDNSGWSLNKITYGDTEIKFNYETTARLDYSENYALKNIEVQYVGSTMKKFRFHTSYFINNSTGTTNYPVYYAYQAADTYRLRLDSLQEETPNGLSSPYKFEYYFNEGLPYRLSNAQDHWGYYNGQNNTSFINFKDIDGLLKGPNNEVYPSYVAECSLKKIIYPTKGYQLFEYESNTVNTIVGQPVESLINVANLFGSTTMRTFNEGYVFVSDTINFENSFYGKYTFSHTIIPSSYSYGFHGILRNIDTGEEVILQSGTHMIPGATIGRYVIIAEILDYTYNALYPKDIGFSIAVNKIEVNYGTRGNHNGPGQRIKQVTGHSTEGVDEVRLYEYQIPDSAISSGVMTNDANMDTYVINKSIWGFFSGGHRLQNYTEFSSMPNYSLSSIGSTYVSYSYVTEYFDNQKRLGKKQTKFLNVMDFDEMWSDIWIQYPFKPTPFLEHKIGKPISEEVYSYENNRYVLKRKVVSRYSSLDGFEIKRQAIKVGFPISFAPLPEMGVDDGKYYQSAIKLPYELKSDVFKLIADTTYQYFLDNRVIAANNRYQYSPVNFEPITVTKNSSDGDSSLVKYQYPYHYVQNGKDPNGIYATMIANNLMSSVVESESFRDDKLLSRKKYLYDIVNSPSSSSILLREVKRWNNQTNQDESETRVEIFDDRGNPIEVLKNGLSKTVLMYSYNKQHLVGEILNANSNMVVDALGGQSVVDAFSGDNPTETQVNTFFNSLRSNLSMKDSKITSFTYKPLVGILSQTDAKGMSSHYKYDDFGRLINIQDQNGNIVKDFRYNYAVDVNTTPIWTDTNVKICETVSGSNTGNELVQQIDTNPNSSTYNTYRMRNLGNTGNCLSQVYAKIFYENRNVKPTRTRADVVVKFFRDSACTLPVSVTGINVNFDVYDDLNYLIYSSSVSGTGTSLLIESQAIIEENDSGGNPIASYVYYLGTSTNYTIVY